jgi:hypothetical protein
MKYITMFSVKLVVRVQYEANLVKYFVLTFCKMYFRRSREGRPLSIVDMRFKLTCFCSLVTVCRLGFQPFKLLFNFEIKM